jgi:hypothetical protein
MMVLQTHVRQSEFAPRPARTERLYLDSHHLALRRANVRADRRLGAQLLASPGAYRQGVPNRTWDQPAFLCMPVRPRQRTDLPHLARHGVSVAAGASTAAPPAPAGGRTAAQTGYRLPGAVRAQERMNSPGRYP